MNINEKTYQSGDLYFKDYDENKPDWVNKLIDPSNLIYIKYKNKVLPLPNKYQLLINSKTAYNWNSFGTFI